MDKSRRRRILAAALLISAATVSRASGAAADASGVLAEFNVEPGAEFVLLPVRVGGKELPFLLDTGSTLSVFDRSLSSAAAVARVAVGAPAGDPVMKGLHPPPEAFVGGLDMRPSGPVLYNDFSALRAVSDRDVWGMIGMQFLKDYIVQVDLDAGIVRFLDPKTRPRPDWGSAVPMRDDHFGVPRVRAEIDGIGPVDFEFDTGDNGGGNLAHSLFDRVFPAGSAVRGNNLFFTGLKSSRLGRVERLSLGNLAFHGVVFGAAGLSSLGMAFARRSAITFDFPHATLYLKPGKRFDSPEDSDMSGLHLLRRDGRIVAMSIDSGSPADRAGIVTGDVIAGVPGRPDAVRDLVALRRLLCSGDGRTVSLSIFRGDQTIPVELTLHKFL
ncbi:MAG: PDZ domain-containing protein [Elusimicrobiota bacterium]